MIKKEIKKDDVKERFFFKFKVKNEFCKWYGMFLMKEIVINKILMKEVEILERMLSDEMVLGWREEYF